MGIEKKYIFLLGGCDLEMAAIKELLLKHVDESRVKDKKLTWGAKLSDYKEYFNERSTFVGIELTEDTGPPENYIRIDHHNENADKPSSIEQIAELLQIKLNREQELIAANDKGYIPALEKYGATKEEITEIRRKDRAAQGVTEKDEKLAEESLQNLIKDKDITIVKSKTKHFSAITDRLYPCNSLLIYTNNELTYYGKGASGLSGHFSQLIKENKAYSGGGENGFFGIAENALKPGEIKKL